MTIFFPLLFVIIPFDQEEHIEWEHTQRAQIFLGDVQIGRELRQERRVAEGRQVALSRGYHFFLANRSVQTQLHWTATFAEDDTLRWAEGDWGSATWSAHPDHPVHLLSEARGPLLWASSGHETSIQALQPWTDREVEVLLSPSRGGVRWRSEGLEGWLFLDEDGGIVREESGPVRRSRAQTSDYEPASVDAILAPSVGSLSEPRARRIVRFKGPSVASIKAFPPHQKRAGESLTVSVPLWEEIPSWPFEPASQSGPIHRRAVEWVRGSSTIKDAVAGLVKGVDGALSYRPTPGPVQAAFALSSGVGDCDEHARLFVQAALSVGIEAREVRGWVVVDDRLYPHVWAEAQMGLGWTPVDPAFGQVIADASRVRSEGLVSQSLRRLKLTVVEAR